MTLEKIGNDINGKMDITILLKDSVIYHIKHKIAGEAYKGLMVLTGKPDNDNDMTLVSRVFKVLKGGKELKGKSVGLNNINQEIFVTHDAWNRSN